MQLAEKIALAAAALIGGGVAHAQVKIDGWEAAGSFLGYSEQSRVSAFEFIGTAAHDYHETAKLNVKVVFDTLTGASANGALAQKSIQTFTSPSGQSRYIAGVNDTPLDNSFEDTRGQLSVSWGDALSRVSNYTLGSNLSIERDYSSFSITGGYSHDFFEKNSTFSIGVALGEDQSRPQGGIPIAFSTMVVDSGQFNSPGSFNTAFAATRSTSTKTVSSAELLLGYTQIVSRRMLLQFNLGYAQSNGYLTDPYKLLSVLDSNGIIQAYRYERRPASRTKDTFYLLAKYHLSRSVMDLSYRYMKDDWQITSQTYDWHWHINSGDGSYWEPHLRFYAQGAASFFTPYLGQGAGLPSYASADYRLGKMNTYTVGLKYGFSLAHQHRAEFRLEYYKQVSDDQSIVDSLSAGSQSSGLSGLTLFPNVTAIIAQYSYFY